MDERDSELDPTLGDLNPDMWINVLSSLAKAGVRNTVRKQRMAESTAAIGPFRVDDLTADLLKQLEGAMRIAKVDIVTIALWLLGDAVRPIIEEYVARVREVLDDDAGGEDD